MAGGISANRIAKWHGDKWSGLADGLPNPVFALAVTEDYLFAGGNYFISTGHGGNAHNIAAWDGSGWLALGSGVNSAVNALSIAGGELYVGGNFTTAGGVARSGIAKWTLSAAPPAPIVITADESIGFDPESGEFGFNVTAPSGTVLVIEGSEDLLNWTLLETITAGSVPHYFSDSQSKDRPARYYRLRRP